MLHTHILQLTTYTLQTLLQSAVLASQIMLLVCVYIQVLVSVYGPDADHGNAAHVWT